MIQSANQNPVLTGCNQNSNCNVNPCQNPDFIIRRYDTRPFFKVDITDCDGPLDLTGLVLEASMWCRAKLKKYIDANANYFEIVERHVFNQLMVGDIIIFDRTRSPEHMLIEAFDEDYNYVLVKRGFQGTTPCNWKRGSGMRIFRFINAPAVTEMLFTEIENVDGSSQEPIRTSLLVYEWQPEDTCMPGCYWLEFRLIKTKGPSFFLPGGFWNGPLNMDSNNDTFTGTVKSNSSVLLSFDPRTGHYLLPINIIWGGAQHLWSDGNYYTGTDQDDGSVYLDITGVPPQELRELSPKQDIVGTPIGLYFYIGQGFWAGPTNVDTNNVISTGSVRTNSSIDLTYDIENQHFLLPQNATWGGPHHIWVDTQYYSGVAHDDGSVLLNTFILPPWENPMNAGVGISVDIINAISMSDIGSCVSDVSTISIIAPLSDISCAPISFSPNISQSNCDLSKDMEWVRKFPINCEGFLISISNSPTVNVDNKSLC